MKIGRYSWWVGLVFFIFACTSTQVQTQVDTTGPAPGQVLTYTGPKARIAVASFKCKAAECSGRIGEGIADMLATALFRTGRFIVLERGEGLRAIQEELNLGQSGYVRPGAAPQIGQMEGADILVIGAITAFEPEASGIGGGGTVIPYKIPLLGGMRFKKKEAYIAADIRLVDVRTGRVISATSVEGKASSWKVGGLMGGVLGDVALGGGLEGYKNTPLEKAVRVMLYNAVEAISRMVPENYYRWGENTPGYNQAPVTPAPTTSPQSSLVPASSGGLVRPSATFTPGKKVIWREDFSSCEEVPTGVRLVSGAAECVQFAGKKWLATTKGEVLFEKTLSGFSFSRDFALEYEFYTKRYEWVAVGVTLGSKHSPYKLKATAESLFWGHTELPGKGDLTNQIHHVALQKKGNMVRIFLDRKKIYSSTVDEVAFSRLPSKLVFFLGSNPANIETGKYTLITNIVVTEY